MSNATLFFRSVLIVAIIAGIPHALAIFTHGTSTTPGPDTEEPNPVNETSDSGQVQDWAYYWQGKYQVSFEGLAEKSIYEIRTVDGQLQCYSVTLIDAQGNRYEANSLVMKSIALDAYKATAKYQIDYEGERFEVDVQMLMDNDGNVTLSYEYYGYQGKETWTRIE